MDGKITTQAEFDACLVKHSPPVIDEARIARDLQAERDYVDGQVHALEQRLAAIDRATELLANTVGKVPTDLQQGISNLGAIVDEKMIAQDSKITGHFLVDNERFASIGTQFAERDVRSEREARDGEIRVNAAFAAQKEAAAEQNKSNTLAITKSEIATTETINKLAELFRTTTDSLGAQIVDLKERIAGSEQRVAGGRQAHGEQRERQMATGTVIGYAVGASGVLIALVALIAHLIP